MRATLCSTGLYASTTRRQLTSPKHPASAVALPRQSPGARNPAHARAVRSVPGGFQSAMIGARCAGGGAQAFDHLSKGSAGASLRGQCTSQGHRKYTALAGPQGLLLAHAEHEPCEAGARPVDLRRAASCPRARGLLHPRPMSRPLAACTVQARPRAPTRLCRRPSNAAMGPAGQRTCRPRAARRARSAALAPGRDRATL
jgi:hypothetical protein